MWGSTGPGDGQFNRPVGVAVDIGGNVYVADQNNNRIQTFSGSGVFIAKWGTSGSGNGQFSFPDGVAVDTGYNVYVADTSNHRIQKFGMVPTAATVVSWGHLKSMYR
jgi:DNA-binding beta-propeller fold protein YncE